MKKLTRILALTLALLTMFALCSEALAATDPVKMSGTKAPDFGESVAFYATTNSASSHTVKAAFQKGTMKIVTYSCCKKSCYMSYEAIVYCKNSAGNWQWESQYTCYNTSGKTLTLKKANTDYKIVIRAKAPMVVWNSYVKNGIISPCTKCKNAANSLTVTCVNSWGWSPEVTLSVGKGIKSLK